MFATVGKVGACIEWAAAYAADPNPFSAARNVAWMATHPRAYEVRRPRPNNWDEIQLLPCTVTRRRGPLSLVLGPWKVTTLREASPTGADAPVQAALIRCIFGNPFRPVSFDLAWRTPQAQALALTAYEARCFEDLPFLADALEEAGCTEEAILSHLRGPVPHVRGCWVIDLVLGRS
jgi:hypothetical protein